MRQGRGDTAETAAYVRRVLRPADPVGDQDYTYDEVGRAVHDRIVGTGASERKWSPKRKRWTVVGATLLVVSVAGAAADATGLVPTGVVKGFVRADSDYAVYGKVMTKRARMLAQARTPEGHRVEWWEAPTTKGGWCDYSRWIEVGKDGKRREDGSTSCGVDRRTPGPTEKLAAHFTVMVAERMGVQGRAAKPAVRVRVRFTNGQRLIVPLTADGFFLAFIDRSVATEADQTRLARAEIAALDANGRVLAVKRM